MSFILLCCSTFLVACDKASEKMGDVSKNVSDVASEMTEKAGESIDNAIDSTVDAAKNTAEQVVENTQEKVTSVVDSAKASASDAVDNVKEAGEKVANEVSGNVSNKADAVVAAVSKESVSEASLATDLGADIKEGEKVYKSSCIACHGSGIAGSPKVGEKADWEARIAQGKAVLIDHAINGFRGKEGYYMPAKGGSKHLSDEQIAKVVEYMISEVQ